MNPQFCFRASPSRAPRVAGARARLSALIEFESGRPAVQTWRHPFPPSVDPVRHRTHGLREMIERMAGGRTGYSIPAEIRVNETNIKRDPMSRPALQLIVPARSWNLSRDASKRKRKVTNLRK